MERLNIIRRSNLHKVQKEFSGKRSFYKVTSPEGREFNISLQVWCDCEYCSIQGKAHGEICSYIVAVLKRIVKEGGIQYVSWTPKQMVQSKRNESLQLLQDSNISINEVRVSTGESFTHIWMKSEICKKLQAEGKQFVTEAIFKTGGRADIFVLDDFLVIEIAKSEKPESIERKKALYPRGVQMQVIRI